MERQREPHLLEHVAIVVDPRLVHAQRDGCAAREEGVQVGRPALEPEVRRAVVAEAAAALGQKRNVVFVHPDPVTDGEPGADEAEGASIEISLPLPCAMEETDASCETAAPAVEGSLEGLRVLAADDNEIFRLVLKECLAHLGVAATVVDGGSEAITAAANHRFDLILLDISMPSVDGEQALTTIRAHAATSGHPRTPAIAVTANAFPEQVAGYLAAGFDGHAAKPLSLPKLREEMLRVGAAP